MRSSEWVALAYFGLLAGAAAVRRLPPARRMAILAAGGAMAIVVVATARAGSSLVRDWAPAVFILFGYFLSGRFFVAPSPRFEAWLAQWDARVLGPDPPTRFARWPRAVLEYLDAVYVGCFLLVPGGYAVLVSLGRAADADRYWTIVVASEFAAFVSLAFVQARPPWLVERPAVLPAETMHRVASWWVRIFTIQVNTFPSGHVAGSLAVALALMDASMWMAAIFFVLASSIAAACVTGRYHYVADVVTGAAVALIVWTMSRAFAL